MNDFGYICSFCSNKETSENDVLDDKKDTLKYDYPTAVVHPNQPVATYETVSLHKEDGSDTAYKATNSDETTFSNPVYSEVHNPHTGDPQLQPNPAYNKYSRTTDHS